MLYYPITEECTEWDICETIFDCSAIQHLELPKLPRCWMTALRGQKGRANQG